MDEETIIELVFRRQDFEEIYFKDNQGSIFFGPSVKVAFVWLLVVVFTFLLFLCYSITENMFVIFTGVLLLILIFVCCIYFVKARHVWKWKHSINSYLTGISKVKSHKIILTSSSLSISQDAEETIEKWSEIKRAIIKKDCIILFGGITYLFPKKSMTEDNYNYLVDLVNCKLKNAL